MSFRDNVEKIFQTMKEGYQEVDKTDKILDLISISGVMLFIIAFIFLYVGDKINAINITMTIYPLALGGIAAGLRMKKRDNPKAADKLLKEWVIITSGMTVVSVITIIVTLIIG